jgi:hypothetical protein
LLPGTTYHYQVFATNNGGSAAGSDAAFSTPALAPTVTTAAASSIASGTATLNATVNPNGASTACYFEYGLTTSYGSTSATNTLTGTSAQSVGITISSLLPGTTYHFRVKATNSVGTATGSDATFVTLALAPTATTTSPAINITSSSASLRASVNPNGASTTYYFEWGLTTSYGSTTTAGTLTGTSTQSVTNSLTGLLPGRTYNFRVRAANSVGTNFGANVAFSTPATAPGVTTSAASSIGATNATLNASVSANGATTQFYFQYGSTTNYGSSTSPINISSTASGALSVQVNGLSPATTYQYRAVASNSLGAAFGNNLTFTTANAKPSVTTLAASNLGTNAASFNASVNPNGAATTYYFEYGPTTSYGTRMATNTLSAGNTLQSLSLTATGLAVATSYHYRIQASNSLGTSTGADVVFLTSAAQSASGVGAAGSTLTAIVNPNGLASTLYFQYGLTTDYGGETAPVSLGSGTSPLTVNFDVGGLLPNETYHYRYVLVNSGGTTYGADSTFTTTLIAPSAGTALQFQSFSLSPGWNAIFLQVQPTNTDINFLFAGVPIESVWTYNSRLTSVDFIEDPSEPVWNRRDWLVHIPTNQVESFQNNLFHLSANRAYLVKVAGNAAATLTVCGRPVLRNLEWRPDTFNLRGFPVATVTPPTFLSFFRPSAAHYNSVSGQLESIYRLNAAGQWTLVQPQELMRAGEAYWVYCRGASDYAAPLSARPSFGTELNYGTQVDELSIALKNSSDVPHTVTVRDLSTPSIFSYSSFDPALGNQWINLPTALNVTVAAGQVFNLRLALRRQDFLNPLRESILVIDDSGGVRYQVAMSAEKIVPAERVAAMDLGDAAKARFYAGLWVGDAIVNGVNEVNAGNLVTNTITNAITSEVMQEVTRVGVSTNPAPTKSEFALRLILHVGTNGETRLLREVIQLFKPGTFTNDVNGIRVQDQPSREILLTDDSLIGRYQGALPRDGQFVGRRISSATFDFDGRATNSLLLTGSFGGTNTIVGAINLPPSFATHPFRHKYHPDHDNLNAVFQDDGLTAEVYSITRQFSIRFTTNAPAGPLASSLGYKAMGGVFRETLLGLHRDPIVVQGNFTLKRVSTTGVLNQ